MRAIGLGLLILLGAVRADAEPPRPRLFILAIAIDAYPEALGLPGIQDMNDKTALADGAKALVERLTKKGDDRAFDEGKVSLLVNEKATGEAIVDALRSVAEAATPEDVFVFYFAGAVMGTPVEVDLAELKRVHHGIEQRIRAETSPDRERSGRLARDMHEATMRELEEKRAEVWDALERAEHVAALKATFESREAVCGQIVQEIEALDEETRAARMPELEAALAAAEREAGEAHEELLDAQEIIVRFIQFDTDPANRDSAMPHPWLAEALSAVPCASQLVVLDGYLDEAVIGRTNVIDVLLNRPPEEVRQFIDIGRMLVMPGKGAWAGYPFTRDHVTRCLLRCLAPQGDLDGSGVVSAAEVRAALPAESYKIDVRPVATGIAEMHTELAPRVLVAGGSFPLHAVGKVQQGTATTRGIGSAQARTEEKPKAAKDGPRRDRALLFAIDEYDDWNDLINPVFDAKALKRTLEDEYGFEVELIENPTLKQLVAALVKYQKTAFGSYDQLLVFFAGHGHYTETYGTGYIIPKDASRPTEAAPRPERALAHRELRHMVGKIPCRHTLLVLDSCFSGVFDKRPSDGGTRGAADYEELQGEELIRRLLKYEGRHYMTSGGKAYVPDGDRNQHSPFARALLGGLREAASHKKAIRFQGLVAHVSGLKAQEPRAGSFGGEPGATFVFVPK